MAKKVKERATMRGTRISSKHQVTIPKQAMTSAGLRTGDRLRAETRGRGRVLLIREDDPVARHAGRLTGTWQPDELNELRDEWR